MTTIHHPDEYERLWPAHAYQYCPACDGPSPDDEYPPDTWATLIADLTAGRRPSATPSPDVDPNEAGR